MSRGSFCDDLVLTCSDDSYVAELASSQGIPTVQTISLAFAFSSVSKKTAHADHIWWLAANGISAGWKKGTVVEYHPNAAVKRGDMAAFLNRPDGLS